MKLFFYKGDIMSKVKDYLLVYLAEQEFFRAYEEYLDVTDSSPTAIELDKHERECLAMDPRSHHKSIVAKIANNPNYHLERGV
jgi:hypothetical protein